MADTLKDPFGALETLDLSEGKTHYYSLERLEKGGAGQLIVDGPENPDVLQVVKRGSGGGGGH